MPKYFVKITRGNMPDAKIISLIENLTYEEMRLKIKEKRIYMDCHCNTTYGWCLNYGKMS